MIFLLTHVAAALVAALGLSLFGFAWQPWLERAGSGPLRPIALFVSSLATWMVLAFALCALGLFQRGPVLALLLVAAVASLYFARRARSSRSSRAAPAPAAATSPPRDRDGRLLVLALPLAGLFAALLVRALTERMAHDADVYHLAIPRLFIEAHGFRRIPFNVYSNWPLGTELLYGLVLLFADHLSATLLHLGFGLLVTLALVRGCAVAGGAHARWAGFFAAAFFWMNPVCQVEASEAYVDLAYAFFFVATFLLGWCAFQSTGPQRDRLLLLAGVAAGMTASIKLNGVIGAGCIGLFCLWRTAREPERAWRPLLLRFALPAFSLAVLWPIKTWLFTGNPAYPFFHAALGGPDWSDALTRSFSEWQRAIGMGRRPLDFLLLPLRVILQGGDGYAHFDGRLSPGWLLLLPLAISGARRNPFVRACVTVGSLYAALWALSSQQLRFLLPGLALFSLAAGVALIDAISARARGSARSFLWAALPACALLCLGSAHTVLGAGRSARELLRDGSAGLLPRTNPLYRFIDEQLPARARLLLINTNLRFFIHRELIADSFFEASQLQAWLGPSASLDEVRAKLAGAGITHLLVSENGAGIAWPPGLRALAFEHRGVRILFFDPVDKLWLLELCRDASCAPEEPGPAQRVAPSGPGGAPLAP